MCLMVRADFVEQRKPKAREVSTLGQNRLLLKMLVVLEQEISCKTKVQNAVCA